jgi:hypothetical protein
MTVASNSILQMYLLMGVTTPQAFLKDRFPNVTFVLQNSDPTKVADSTFNRPLFSKVDRNVYDAFHNYLVGLNGGRTTLPPVVEQSHLAGAYTMAGSMVTMTDFAFGADEPWPGGSQHPPGTDVEDLFNKLA